MQPAAVGRPCLAETLKAAAVVVLRIPSRELRVKCPGALNDTAVHEPDQRLIDADDVAAMRAAQHLAHRPRTAGPRYTARAPGSKMCFML